MTEELLSNAQERAVVAAGKWGTGLSPRQPTHEVAHGVLAARLKAVSRWLPLAAEKSEEDVEYVHQLRIACRRAVAALRTFAELIPADACGEMREWLREVRAAADEARNWDVLADLFLHGCCLPSVEIAGKLAAEVKARRQTAQEPVAAIHRELAAAGFDQQSARLLAGIAPERHGKGGRPFGRCARQYLAGVLKKFSKAAGADLSSAEALHALRIRTKKLRYTMEIVAMAFPAAFRKRLYPRIGVLQDMMGMVNDHRMGKDFYHDWSLKVEDLQEKAFLEGLALGETRAHRDMHQAFLMMWTPQAVDKLRGQFHLYCGLS